MTRINSTVALVLLIAACNTNSNQSETSGQKAAAPPSPAGGVVDSVFPMDVMLERFRHDIPQTTTLQHGLSSRDALVNRIVELLAKNDTSGFEPLALNQAEYAWLYFPTSPESKPPYELPPALGWFQVQEYNRKGVLRALRELGGHKLQLRGYTCAAKPVSEGSNLIWKDCRVDLSRNGAKPVNLRLFGAIMERDGKFVVVSFANDF